MSPVGPVSPVGPSSPVGPVTPVAPVAPIISGGISNSTIALPCVTLRSSVLLQNRNACRLSIWALPRLTGPRALVAPSTNHFKKGSPVLQLIKALVATACDLTTEAMISLHSG
uniref:Uncharacterized protein n=1 Tax=viral metagenome TaxID=1070528 RepID=A0A6C0BR97_9ZZZZ